MNIETILQMLLSESTYFATLACVFTMFFILWYVLAKKIQVAMAEYQTRFTATAASNTSDMFLSIDSSDLFKLNIVAIIILPSITWFITEDLMITLTLLVGMILLPSFVYRILRKQRLKRFEEQLPDGLTMVSGAMRAGASLNIALESLVDEQPAPLSQEFELFLKEQRLGVDFEVSLKSMYKRVPLPDFNMLVTALLINKEVGGNLAETMETLADTLRKKSMMEGKIDGLTAQGRLQGIVMSGLPIFIGLILNFIEPEAMSKLWTTTIGWFVLGLIIVMEGLAYAMISKITNIDV
ncbi:MAG: secretion system protein F [Legionellales bacterium]|nr:secretion system protein F [Legionellales bacterium]